MNVKEAEPLERLSYSSPYSQQLTCSSAHSRPSICNRWPQRWKECPKLTSWWSGKEKNHSGLFILCLKSYAAYRSFSEGLGSINYVKLLAADSSSNVREPGFWRHIYQVRQQLLNLILAHRIMAQCIISWNWEQYTIFTWLSGAMDGVNTDFQMVTNRW